MLPHRVLNLTLVVSVIPTLPLPAPRLSFDTRHCFALPDWASPTTYGTSLSPCVHAEASKKNSKNEILHVPHSTCSFSMNFTAFVPQSFTLQTWTFPRTSPLPSSKRSRVGNISCVLIALFSLCDWVSPSLVLAYTSASQTDNFTPTPTPGNIQQRLLLSQPAVSGQRPAVLLHVLQRTRWKLLAH